MGLFVIFSFFSRKNIGIFFDLFKFETVVWSDGLITLSVIRCNIQQFWLFFVFIDLRKLFKLFFGCSKKFAQNVPEFWLTHSRSHRSKPEKKKKNSENKKNQVAMRKLKSRWENSEIGCDEKIKKKNYHWAWEWNRWACPHHHHSMSKTPSSSSWISPNCPHQ